jgi:GNAT superfamily N-acetyltransferase
MSTLQIKAVTTRRERKDFLALPHKLYHGDPYWIPPIRVNEEELVGYRKHPFYDLNRVQTFVAYRDGQACGRVAAIRNQGHIDRYGENLGFFGFFECVDDQETANALFDAARQWFAEQGITWIRGPMNPSMNYEMGLLVEGFDSSPTFMMTYNPQYYEKLICNYGFCKSHDLYAYWGHRDMLPPIRDKLAPISKKIIEHLGLKLRPLDKSHFNDDVHTFLGIFNRSMAAHWGFVPMTEKEVEHLAKGMRMLMIPELSVAAEIDGKVVGAMFGMPDYNPRIRKINGRLFPFGFLRLLWNRKGIKRVRMVSTNVVPEYQMLGVGLALMAAMAPRALDWGIEECEFSWVLESNAQSRGSLEKGGAKRTKTYRLYDLGNPASRSNGSTSG